jgi:hypothetical protein
VGPGSFNPVVLKGDYNLFGVRTMSTNECTEYVVKRDPPANETNTCLFVYSRIQGHVQSFT